MTIVADGRWYETKRLDDGVTLILESHVKPFYRCNIWHVRGRDRDLLFDTGMGAVSLRANVAFAAERPLLAVASHAHYDHVGGHHEFAERAVHRAEADILTHPTRANTVADAWVRAAMFAELPSPGYDPDGYEVRPAPPTMLLDEGAAIDLGDRRFEVIHLPGHSPGSIALWEAATGILFSGDVVYDGELIDTAWHAEVDRYVASMERLRGIPARVVHAGHYASFGRERLTVLIDDYLAGKRASGCPAATITTP